MNWAAPQLGMIIPDFKNAKSVDGGSEGEVWSFMQKSLAKDLSHCSSFSRSKSHLKNGVDPTELPQTQKEEQLFEMNIQAVPKLIYTEEHIM